MKTRRGACSLRCSAFSAARSAATSGRSCSAACSVFFEGDAVTVEEAPDRADAGLLLSLRAQPRADLLKRQVRFRGDQIDQPLPVHLQRRAAVTGAGLGIYASCRPPAIHPADRRRRADAENARGLACALAGLDDLDRSHPKVLRVSLRHRLPPQLPLEASESDLRVRGNPLWPFRFTSTGKRSRMRCRTRFPDAAVPVALARAKFLPR